MPTFFIFDWSVVRFIPSRAAAPSGPLSTHPVWRRTPRMWSRSASASVPGASAGTRAGTAAGGGPFLPATREVIDA